MMISRKLTFTIVTISFNQRKYLSQAINSVLGQGTASLEYIVVDPGSTDGSRQLLENYDDERMVVILEPDDGPADGLNKGFAASKGNILAFLNSDDVLLPGSLELVSNYFANHPEIDLLVGDGIIIDGAGNKLKNVRGSGFSLKSYLYGGATWIQQSVFFRGEIFRRVGGFNPKNRTSWDGELFLQMLRMKCKVGYLHHDIGCFRIHDASITGTTSGVPTKYIADRNRMFFETTGRAWNKFDVLVSYAYRVARLFTDPRRIIDVWNRRSRG